MSLRPGNNSANYSNLTLDEWVSKFGRMYGKRHDKHTTEYLISRLVEEVAELVDPMEAQDRERIPPALADVFSWTCSISFKLNIDLSRVAWKKYGEETPRPEWSKGILSNNPVAIEKYSEPRTLSEWQEAISRLYRAENARLTPMIAVVAMMKDVGDLAMNQRKRESLEQTTSKLAAIMAWTLTIAELLKIDLAEAVYSKYDSRCPVCGQEICDTDVCHPFSHIYLSFASGTTDEEKYVVLDVASMFNLKPLVNSSPSLHRTKDLSESLDLINRSDCSCIIFSDDRSGELGSDHELLKYRQIFEVFASYSLLSKGNIWIFTKEPGSTFVEYVKSIFGDEHPLIEVYSDSARLRALFENSLRQLAERRKLSKEPRSADSRISA